VIHRIAALRRTWYSRCVRRAIEGAFHRGETTVEAEEREGGHCPWCRMAARLFQCWQCCDAVWMIACSHRPSPMPMRFGRRDGTDAHRVFCSDCSAPVD